MCTAQQDAALPPPTPRRSTQPEGLVRQRELRTRLLRNMRSRRQLAQLSEFLRRVRGLCCLAGEQGLPSCSHLSLF